MGLHSRPTAPMASEHTGDAGDYFARIRYALSGGDGPDQALTIAETEVIVRH